MIIRSYRWQALERCVEGVLGLRNAEIDPARPSGRAFGLRLTGFEPGMALEWGAEGVFGLMNG